MCATQYRHCLQFDRTFSRFHSFTTVISPKPNANLITILTVLALNNIIFTEYIKWNGRHCCNRRRHHSWTQFDLASIQKVWPKLSTTSIVISDGKYVIGGKREIEIIKMSIRGFGNCRVSKSVIPSLCVFCYWWRIRTYEKLIMQFNRNSATIGPYAILPKNIS